MNQTFFNRIPASLPGGFFIYRATGTEDVCFADKNVLDLYGCETMEEFRAHTGNSFRGMVCPEDLDRVEREIAAQTFVAEANDRAARGQDPTASLAALAAAAEAATQGITATATASDDATRIFAEFTTPGGRVLKVTLTRDGTDAWRIDAWRMTGVVNEEQPIGTLYLGD